MIVVNNEWLTYRLTDEMINRSLLLQKMYETEQDKIIITGSEMLFNECYVDNIPILTLVETIIDTYVVDNISGKICKPSNFSERTVFDYFEIIH